MKTQVLAIAAICAAVTGCTAKTDSSGPPETTVKPAAPEAKAQGAVAVDNAHPVVAKGAAPAAPAAAGVGAACPGPNVDFHGNTQFEGIVNAALGQKEGSAVARADLGKITALNLSPMQVNDLDPCIFPFLTGATELDLGAGALSDISNLAPLVQLETLQIYVNRVNDLTPLTKMTRLQRLDLERTKITDLTPLGGMTALTQLQIDDTPVADVTPLGGCSSLEKLSMRNTKVTDLSPLKTATKLKLIYTEGSPIGDVSALQPLMSGGMQILRKGRF